MNDETKTIKLDPKDDPEQNTYLVERRPGWKIMVIKDREKFNKEARELMNEQMEETKVEGMRPMERFIYLTSRDIDNFNKKKRSFIGF